MQNSHVDALHSLLAAPFWQMYPCTTLAVAPKGAVSTHTKRFPRRVKLGGHKATLDSSGVPFSANEVTRQ
jgi:hypothetical protein